MFGDLGEWLSRVIGGGISQTGLLLICVGLPFALVTLLLHWLERQIQLPLVRRFGWRSILWTGWLGTPIHELSHVVLCKIFGHRVDEMALFKPDRNSGRLGYVKHSFNRKNYLQVVGNFFIGIAPLAGGSFVLLLLVRVFYPSAAEQVINAKSFHAAIANGLVIDSLRTFFEIGFSVLSKIVTLDNVASIQFWLFIYLTLCVGSHMAPSRDDYRGALGGGVLVLLILFLTNAVLLIVRNDTGDLIGTLATVLGPALGMLSLCVILCSLVALLVFLGTSVLDMAFGSRRA